MYKHMLFFRKLARLLYQYFYIILILNMVNGLFDQPVIPFRWWLYVLGLLAISYTLRDVMSQGVVLFLGHLVLGVLSFFLVKNIFIKVFILFIVAFLFFDGLVYLHNNYTIRRNLETPFHAIIFGFCTFGIGCYFHNSALINVSYVVTVCILMMYFVSLYVEGLEGHLEKTSFLEGAPLKQIISVNSLIVLGILLGSVIVIIVGNLLHFDELLMRVWEYILFCIKILLVIGIAIFQFLFAMMGLGLPNTQEALQPLKQVEDKPNMFADILQFILTAAIILFIVYIVFSFFKWLIRLLILRHRKDTDIVEDLSSKKRRGVKFERYSKPDKLAGNSPEMKARRIYRKKVLTFKRFFVPVDSSTTGDILDMMNHRSTLDKVSTKEQEVTEKDMEAQSKNEEISDMYNQVRYGGLCPNSEFLKKMKKL